MLAQLRHPATAISVVALLIALEVPAYAASFIHGSRLKPNTVTSTQIKNATLIERDLATPLRVKLNAAITSAKVANGSLGEIDMDAAVRAKLDSTGGAPTGAAGGDLAGTYPDPTVKDGAITASKLVPNEALRAVGAVGQPAFQNLWNNFEVNGAPLVFRKDRDGIVHIYGMVSRDGASANFGTESVVFTLPAGYRPAGSYIFPLASHMGTFAIDAGGFATASANGNIEVNASTDDRNVYFGDVSFPAAG